MSLDSVMDGNGAQAEEDRNVTDLNMDVQAPGASTQELTCQCVLAQVASRVFTQSFIQEFCKKHISPQESRPRNESNLIDCLQPDLLGRKDLSHSSKGHALQDRRKAKWEDLPEEVIERIMARIPFPSLFKVKLLSRSWFFKFPFQAVRSLKPSFQNQICEASVQWTTYCPVFLTDQYTFLCFDRISFQWKPLVHLSYLPPEVVDSRYSDYCFENCDVVTSGPLVCFVHNCIFNRTTVFVSNVITKSWRKLLDLELIGFRPMFLKLLQVGSESYKILLVYVLDENVGQTHLYDSSRRTWTVKSFNYHVGRRLNPYYSAYLDKKLYCQYIDEATQEPELALMIYDVEHDEWAMEVPKFTPGSLVSRRISDSTLEIADSALGVCNDKIMLAVWFRDHLPGRPDNTIRIFQLDLCDTKWLEVCPGPMNSDISLLMPSRNNVDFASAGDFLYFHVTYPTHPESWFSYDVRSHKWSEFPNIPDHLVTHKKWLAETFEPGLNPFALV